MEIMQDDLRQNMLTALYFIKIALAVEKKTGSLPEEIVKVLRYTQILKQDGFDLNDFIELKIVKINPHEHNFLDTS